MTSMKKAAAAAMLLVASLAPAETRGDGAGAAGPPAASATLLRVSVSPHFGRAPAVVRIEAFVEPGAGNRALEFVVDSSSYFSSSTIELRGADAPRVHRVELRSIPGGTHDIVVRLTGSSGDVRAVVHDRVVVYE